MADIVLAQVLGAHGVKGDVALRVYAEEAKSLLRYSFEVHGAQAKLISIKPGAKGVWIARLSGCDSRDAAEALKGVQLSTTRAALPALSDDYYIADLIGLTVLHGGQPVGRVTGAPDFGAGTLLDIALDGGKGLYLPFEDDFVGQIDLSARTVEIHDFEAFL